jgi:hypothetical protein
VRVGSIDLSLLSGRGTITDVTIANPAGFSTAPFFVSTRISLHLDQWSVLDRNATVVIHRVHIQAPRFRIERTRQRATNLALIGTQLKAVRRGADLRAIPHRPRKLVVERFTISNARFGVAWQAERRSGAQARRLPAVDIHDVGTAGGLPPRKVARHLFSRVATQLKDALGAKQGQ